MKELLGFFIGWGHQRPSNNVNKQLVLFQHHGFPNLFPSLNFISDTQEEIVILTSGRNRSPLQMKKGYEYNKHFSGIKMWPHVIQGL